MEYIPTLPVHLPGIFVPVPFGTVRCRLLRAVWILHVPSEALVILLWEKTCSIPFERSCVGAEQLANGKVHGRTKYLLLVCACFIQVDCFIHHS